MGLVALGYSMVDISFIVNIAKQESEKSTGRYKVGAVIFRGKNILVKGHNINKTHPKWGSGFNSKLHAETNLLYLACRNGIDVSASSIYIYRQNEFGEAIAKPCLHCYNKLKAYGIEEIYYSGSEEEEKENTYKLLYSY